MLKLRTLVYADISQLYPNLTEDPLSAYGVLVDMDPEETYYYYWWAKSSWVQAKGLRLWVPMIDVGYSVNLFTAKDPPEEAKDHVLQICICIGLRGLLLSPK
jgi:hypothetical protein